MKDSSIHELARRAGIMVEWRDYADKAHAVTTESLRAILAAVGLPAESSDDLAQSRHRLDLQELPRLITATAGEPIPLPLSAEPASSQVRLCEENGTNRDLNVQASGRSFV